MKRGLLIVVGCWLMVGGVRAQWVSIPDTNFATYLCSVGYANGFRGNNTIGWEMDTTNADIIGTTSVGFGSGISSIEGIQYFDNLRSLGCKKNSVSSLPPLPSLLSELDFQYTRITSFLKLPNSLTSLKCGNNNLDSLPALPSSLRYLVCDSSQLNSLPELPDSLEMCNVSDNPLTCLPTLKYILTFLFRNTLVTCVPNYGNVVWGDPAIHMMPLCDSTNNNNGCQVFNSVDAIRNSQSAIRISPNPATTSLSIQLPQTPSRSTVFQLFDITGRMILEKPLTETNSQIDVRAVSKGMYLYNVVSGQEKAGGGKLVVE